MVSFIHSESEITTWIGHNFKIKRKKPKATLTSFLNLKLRIIRLAQGHSS